MLAGWFKMRVWLSKSPEVVSIAAAVGKEPQYVVGALSDVWSWANQYGKNGVIPKASEVHVDKEAQCEGFAKAMVAVGWLVIDENGVTVPKFGEYHYLPKETVPPSAKSSSAERVRRHRARKKADAAKVAAKAGCNGNGQIEIEKESNYNPPKSSLGRGDQTEETNPHENTNGARIEPSTLTLHPAPVRIGAGGDIPRHTRPRQARQQQALAAGIVGALADRGLANELASPLALCGDSAPNGTEGLRDPGDEAWIPDE